MTEPMTPREFEELDDLFQRAVELSTLERAVLIDQVRQRSPVQAQRLVAMLEADESAGNTVDSAMSEVSRQLGESGDPLLGECFGPYRIDEVLGRGGMGTVYRGTRVDGEFRQIAAIKTVRYGLESPEWIARFHREREILAQMSHSGIARLLDGGTGPRGLPFVAMEFVEGVPLTEYVGANECDLRERLRLFAELCDTVAFVHRNLIVHRDIKPANVMVTPDGRVKLLDFGIARLTDEFGSGGTATATQLRAMTPDYASPEQILGQTVTTSADIYALGVLLYELLTGDRPIRLDTQNPLAMAQAIVEHDPTAPSDFLARVDPVSAGPAARSRLQPRQLRGDLDRITMMALRKEPERRYASAAMFADDVRRFLEGRPVQAQIDSWHYRLRKFVQRHPLSSGAAVVALAVILGFSLLTQRQSRRLAAERDRAVEAESHAAAGADFLEDLFSVADPRTGGDRGASALDMLHAGIERLDRDHALVPSVRAEMYLTVGLALCNLEEFAAGIPALEKSVSLHEQISGRRSLPTANAMHRLGDVLRRVDRYDEAFALMSEALEIRREHFSEESYEIADSYNNLAILAVAMGEYEKSEKLQAESVEMHTRVSGADSQEVSTALNNLALLKRRRGKIDESLELSRRSFEIKSRGPDRSGALLARNGMALSLQREGRHEEALSLFTEVLAGQTLLLGDTHSRRLTTTCQLAALEIEMGRYEEAARRLADIEPVILESHGERSMSYARWLQERATLDRHLGDLERAEVRIRLAAEIHEERTGDRHFGMPTLWLEHGRILADLGRFAEAEEELRRSLDHLPSGDDYPHVLRARVLNVLARVRRAQGSADDAARALAESRKIIDATVGPRTIELGEWWLESARLCHARGDDLSADDAIDSAAEILEPRLPDRHPLLVALRAERAR